MDERKLLIADDSELNRAILVSVLEKDFDILEAADGKEAIATLLLDVVMPEADGFEVLEEMNRRGWIDEIPTIMISVETGGSYIDRAFQLGAADYVSRPFVPNMIRRRVINAILLHTKTRKLTGLIADLFYRRERNTDILAAILGYAVEFRSGERGTHMTAASRDCCCTACWNGRTAAPSGRRISRPSASPRACTISASSSSPWTS